ncbi:hypothetical protein E3O67_00565 [Cryobacterium sp. TMT3-29-2]|nr:hypothetical protein E3O67_00565 [Cryobacterium sp. TMT3-29-2]
MTGRAVAPRQRSLVRGVSSRSSNWSPIGTGGSESPPGPLFPAGPVSPPGPVLPPGPVFPAGPPGADPATRFQSARAGGDPASDMAPCSHGGGAGRAPRPV